MPIAAPPGAAAPNPHLGRARLRPLVAAPVGGAPGSLRDARPAALGAALPGGDRLGVLVPAERGVRSRAGGGAARHRGRAAADAAAPDREPRAADPDGARAGRAAPSTTTPSWSRPRRFTLERPEISNLIWLSDQRASRRQLLGHDVSARDRHQRRRHAGVAAGREVRRARPRRPSSAPRETRQTVVLAAVRRQLRQPGLPGADPARRPRRVPRRADRRVLGRAAAALLRADRDRAPPRDLGARRALRARSPARSWPRTATCPASSARGATGWPTATAS